MASYPGRLEDAAGNIYYTESMASDVKMADNTTAQDKITALDTKYTALQSAVTNLSTQYAAMLNASS